MDEDGEVSSPFWVKSSINRRRTHRIRSGLSSLFFSSGLLVVLLLLTAVCFLVFVVPSTLSLSAKFFRPNTVKKSWDSLNVVLVLFALVFGFLSRIKNGDRNYDDYQTSSLAINESQESNPSTPPQRWYDDSRDEAQKSNPLTPRQWYGYSDPMMAYNSSIGRGGLRRTSSSYPDLHEASYQLISGEDPRRFYDDMRVDTYRVADTDQFLHRRQSWKDKVDVVGDLETNNIYVDTIVSRSKDASYTTKSPSTPLPASPPSPPSPARPLPPSSPSTPPAQPVSLPKVKPKRANRSVAHKRDRRSKRKDDELEQKDNISSPVTPPAPPPPPPLPQLVDQKTGKSDKKRSGASATKDFLNSLYHKKKKKKQRQKSVENFDSLLHQSQTPPLHFQLPPPSPPPPPPPPPSVFHNLFASKKSVRKNTDPDIFVSTISAPSPPSSSLTTSIALKSTTSQLVPVASNKLPKPVRVTSFDSVEENLNSGGESPLIPIPPPPPPPPFAKSLSWKFVVQGDYVRVDSNLSSRSGSPEPNDVESDGTPTAANDGATPLFPSSPLFCPSPDVNTKAEDFISTFRAGLKLEKINSMKKRHRLGLSNLGRGSDPTQH